MDRGDHVDTDIAARVLAHLFMHQTHHRGQVHAMLCGTPVKPPQLDEFLLASDARFRVEDLKALGWSEELLMRGPPLTVMPGRGPGVRDFNGLAAGSGPA